jgi:hypothetical protein
VTTINWKTIRQDLGGQWFLDRKFLLALVPFLIVISVLASENQELAGLEVDPEPWSRYLKLVIANVLSIAICWGFLELAAATAFRSRKTKPVRLSLVLGFSALLGFLKGFTTGYFSWLLGSEYSLELAIGSRVVQTTLLGAWSVPLVTLWAATFAKYQAERAMLVEERVSQALSNSFSKEVDQDHKSLDDFVTRSKHLLAAIPTGAQGSAREVATLIRSLIEEELRPLSHRIFQRELLKEREFKGIDLVMLALRKNPFPIQVIAIGFAIGLLPINLATYSDTEALVRTGITVLIATSMFFAFGKARPKSRFTVVALFMLGNTTVAVVAPILTDFVFGVQPSFERLFAWIALLFWLLQLSLMGSVVAEVLSSRSEVRRELASYIGEAALNSSVQQAVGKLQSRELAQFVHSDLQNKLLSSALRFEGSELTPEQLRFQISQIELLLDGVMDSYRGEETQSLSEEIERVRRLWDGFVHLSFVELADDTQVGGDQTKLLLQVISEAISNSVRHGLASKVEVEIKKLEPEDRFLEITIADDGLGPRSGSKGLGSELFTAASQGNWSLTQNVLGGSILKLQFEIKP